MLRKYFLSFVTIVMVLGASIAPVYAQQSGGQQGLTTMPLEVISTSEGSIKFLVELAVSYEQQRLGMMYRTHLDPDKGMFFIYGEPGRRGYWMKDCLIYLDIIYIREDGRIANIIRNATPGDETPRYSRGPVLAVLEIAGGRAKELGIKPGDRVVHSIFKLEKPE
jgi:uncharacterized protein